MKIGNPSKGDIIRNNHAGENNPYRFLVYSGKGIIKQGRYTHKSYDCIGYDGKKIQIFIDSADIEKMGHMREFDDFMDSLARLKELQSVLDSLKDVMKIEV